MFLKSKKKSSFLKVKKKKLTLFKTKKKKPTKIKLKPARNREKSFLKWSKEFKDDEETILIGKFWDGSPPFQIYFNTKLEHFYLEFIAKDKTICRLANTYSISFVEGLTKALKKVKKKGFIKFGRAPMPPEEE